jgi:hypothetical protein
MKLILASFVFLCIFAMRNNFNYGTSKKTYEPRDGRASESIASSYNYHNCSLFRSDPSLHALNSNFYVMRNNEQIGRNASKTAFTADYYTPREIYVAKLAEPGGFVACYFKKLPFSKSCEEAFMKVSMDYYALYQHFPYLDYTSFKSNLLNA